MKRKYLLLLIMPLLFLMANCKDQGDTVAQGDRLNEEWHFNKDMGNGLSETISHRFTLDGRYEYLSWKNLASDQTIAEGTYHYQKETNEIFIHIDKKTAISVVGFGVKTDYMDYIKILECRDSAVVADLVSSGKVSWIVNKTGKYELLKPESIETMKQTYNCTKLQNAK